MSNRRKMAESKERTIRVNGTSETVLNYERNLVTQSYSNLSTPFETIFLFFSTDPR